MAFVPPVAEFSRDRARSEAYAPRHDIIDEEGVADYASSRGSNQFGLRKTLENTLPTWFETGFSQFDRRMTGEVSKIGRLSYYDPDQPEIDVNISYESSHSQTQETQLIARYDCDGVDASRFSDDGFVTQSRKKGTKVIMRRMSKNLFASMSNTRREITILSLVFDPCLPDLIDWLETPDALWTVKHFRPYQTLSDHVGLHGPLSDTMTKTALNQLFSGIASLFLAGFAHLRICANTVCLDENQQLLITDLNMACVYGTEKVGNFYAPTQEKYASDIYVAPEVFANHVYNARKAVIWSCGVLLYFMITGQTEKLRNIEHPSFDRIEEDNITTTATTSDPEPGYHQQQQQQHHHRLSLSHAKSKLILYPDRFAVPSYARTIIPKMLMVNPVHRAELIEIASRVPKDFQGKSTRPLMETAWSDYKLHVGPYAGLNIGAEGGVNGPTKSTAASIYSVASNVSQSLGSLLRKGSVGGDGVKRASYTTSSRWRRKSEPVKPSRFVRFA